MKPARPLGRGLVVAAAIALVACSSSPSLDPFSPTAAPSSGTRPALPVGSSRHSMTVGGMQRTYGVYRPASLPSAPALVVMLHGALGTGQQAESSYGWDAQADSGHFVVAYPDGYKRTWNVSEHCCGPAAAQHVDDVGFITTLVKSLSGALPIDRRRIYVTGISNGGMLAYRLACDTTLFAAIGPDSATQLNSCPSPAPLSIIHVHGRADRTIPYGGGPGSRDNGGTGSRPADTDGPPIPVLVETWRHVDHCAAPSVRTRGAITTSSATCPGGRAVELVTIAGAGHQWPGQRGPTGPFARQLDPPYQGFDATAAIWHFFADHPKT